MSRLWQARDYDGGYGLNMGQTAKLRLYRAFVCPRCTVVHASDEGCGVCDYDGDLDEFEVAGGG